MRSLPISTARTAGAEDDGDIDLLQVLGTLRRGKWRILFYMVLMIVLAGFYVFRIATPLYTATSTVALQNRDEQIVDLASPLSALGGDYYTINTEVEALRSRELISKLVSKLDLVADPVFNYQLRPQQNSISIGALIGAVRRLIQPPSAEEEAALPPTAAEIREDVVDTVIASISISNLRSSYVFYITVTTDDPEASARVANGLAEVYIEDQIAVKYKATEQATIWLNGRVAELKDELELAENTVKAFSAATDLVGPETLAALNRQLKDRRDRVTDAKAAAVAMATRATDIEAARESGDPERMVAATDDPVLRRLLPRLGDAGVQNAFDVRFAESLERARFEAQRASTKTATLQASVGELEGQVEQQSAELLKLQQLEREAGASRQIYEYFLGRLKEISVQQGIHRADSRMLSMATLPDRPSSPRKGLILAISAMFGIFLGSALVLIREMRESGFRSAREAEQATGLNVFAQIPKAPVSKRKRLLNYLISKPTSALAEAVRNLRTSVLLSNMDQAPQVIMVTSSLPGEGKTTQSLALTQSFAGMGKRVLLIEGDIRRRTFQEYFSVGRRPGLITAVAGERPLDEIVFMNEQLGADVLMGEKATVNAADFFSSERFKSFLEMTRSQYDVIIIDTPPVLVVPDARVIGQMVDAVIYAVHWNQTTRAQLDEGIHTLTTVDVKISGLTLSQIDLKRAQNYGGKYGELYSSYGRKYYNN